MASGQTPTYLLPYPLSTDPVNLHGDIFELADRLEDVITGISTLPSQSGNSGKYLTTNGTTASWATVPTPSAATPTVLGTVYGITESDPDGNIALGKNSFNTSSTGTNNIAIGESSLKDNTSGIFNNALGYRSLYKNSTGSFNTSIGDYCLYNQVSGDNNTALGSNALGSKTTGSKNTAIGLNAIYGLSTGENNTSIGYNAGYALYSGDNNIMVGYEANPSSSSVSNEVTLGNTSINRLRIPGMEIDWQYVISEEATIVATSATGTINYELTTDRSILYYTSNASGNWVLNLRGNDVLTYDNASTIGKSVTIVFMNTNGATAYYPTAFNIDGTSRTVKWQGGTAPTSGNTNSIDVYTYTIIKTAVNTYTVLGSQTKFA